MKSLTWNPLNRVKMLTKPPEVSRPRGGFSLPQNSAAHDRARLLPDYGETGSRPDMYLLIKRACRRGLLAGFKEAGTTAGAEELFASYLAAVAGLIFTEGMGASSRSPGR